MGLPYPLSLKTQFAVSLLRQNCSGTAVHKIITAPLVTERKQAGRSWIEIDKQDNKMKWKHRQLRALIALKRLVKITQIMIKKELWGRSGSFFNLGHLFPDGRGDNQRIRWVGFVRALSAQTASRCGSETPTIFLGRLHHPGQILPVSCCP